jgi:hypothetical protein
VIFPEDEGGRFSRNVSNFLSYYTASNILISRNEVWDILSVIGASSRESPYCVIEQKEVRGRIIRLFFL